MFKNIFRNKASYFFLLYYLVLLAWWVRIFLSGVQVSAENSFYNFSYSFVALFGGLYGLYVATKAWGGTRSVMGRGLIFLSLGLLGEWFGATVWSYYNIIRGVEIPYPSIADFGFFSIIPLYGAAMVNFGKASGVKISLRTIFGALESLIIPATMVAVSYFLFLRNVEVDWSNPLRTFLDFGYPAGEAVTVSLGILAFSLSVNILGGRMRTRILYAVFAVVFQYITDYLFLYRSGAGLYYNAGVVDLFYTTSYLIMSLGLISFYDVEAGKLALAEVKVATKDIYSQVILKIIAEQQLIVGPVALEEAAKVESLRFGSDLSQVEVVGSGKEVLGALVAQYEKLFGRASIEVCKNVSKDLLSSLPDSEIPQILK